MALGSGSNEIVPFATGVGANVESPVDWDANTVRQQGFQVGVANPTQANTAFRQASFVAAMISQFTADFSGSPTVDDGDVLDFEQHFIDALSAYLAPSGIYFIQDTGSANAVVGTTTPVPEAYTSAAYIVLKKMNADNSGAMTANLWGLGEVALNDNTGAALSAGALKANSLYILAYTAGQFRILGGTATYSNITNLTAASGDGISVDTGGIVNRRRARGTHNTVVNNNDKWARGKSTDDTDLWMLTTEFLAWLISVLPYPIPLTAPRDYYVNSSTGSDSNTGLSAGAAFLTIQKAIDVTRSFNMNGFNVTIHVAAGTYPRIYCMQLNGAGMVFIVGDVVTPANVLVHNTAGAAIFVGASGYDLSGMKVQSDANGTGSDYGAGLRVQGSALVSHHNMEFGSCFYAHQMAGNGGQIYSPGTIGGFPAYFTRVTGNSPFHILVGPSASHNPDGTQLIIVGSLNFSSAFWSASQGSAIQWPYSSISITGSVTGIRYSAWLNGTIFTNGGGANYLPGNAAGILTTGGQYL